MACLSMIGVLINVNPATAIIVGHHGYAWSVLLVHMQGHLCLLRPQARQLHSHFWTYPTFLA